MVLMERWKDVIIPVELEMLKGQPLICTIFNNVVVELVKIMARRAFPMMQVLGG